MASLLSSNLAYLKCGSKSLIAFFIFFFGWGHTGPASAMLSPLGPAALRWFTSASGSLDMASFFSSGLAFVLLRALGLVPALVGVVY